jgi:hypothetical protein
VNSGAADAMARVYQNDPKMAPIVERIADEYVAVADEKAPLGVRYLERDKVTGPSRELSDTEAARVLATDIWIGEQRNFLIRNARASGKPVPEVVYEVARDMGYAPNPNAVAVRPNGTPAATPAAPNGTPQPTVAERIRQQARASAAGKSLSAVTTGGAPDLTLPQIRTMQQWMDFRKKDPAGAARYMEQMNKISSTWHHQLV